MNAIARALAHSPESELSALVATLRRAEDRLEELTAGEVDSVSDLDGRTFLLQRAQSELRRGELAKRAAILNALPAKVALIDAVGVIVSVNQGWSSCAPTDDVASPGRAVGTNCLATNARPVRKQAAAVAKGIRAVLSGAEERYSIEYATKSAVDRRWFLLTVTPLAIGKAEGAVLMHVDITDRKESEIRIQRLNRGYLMLSQINSLIVRVSDRDELFREACRIVVEVGGFAIAWIGMVDARAGRIVPVTSVGPHGEFLRDAGGRMLLADDTPLGHGPSALAVRSRSTTVVNDIASDPRVRDAVVHLRRGVRSLVSLPMIVDGRVVAVLGLHAREVGYFDAGELALLDELAGDVAFAIDHIGKAEKINYLAYFDALTGLPNQAMFLQRAARCLKNAGLAGDRLALVLIDLERFKSFNDSLGQNAGDELLRHVARWLEQNLDDPTLLARVGSDHFAMMLPDPGQAGDVARPLDILISNFHAHDFVHDGTAFRIAAKFGIAVFPDDADDTADAEALFRMAESALKNAKLSGSRHLFYTHKMTESVARRLSMENQLRRALENEEFVLHYQPKVDLRSGGLTGCEALIRWNSPSNGLVPPIQFIPILEETGLIQEVGSWALRKSLEDHLSWRSRGLPAVRIAVNVSPMQLQSPGFVAQLDRLVRSNEFAAEGLELEITESMIMADIDAAILRLQAIRAMGIRISIDDFGTGFSSLGYLSKLPVDSLKIDRSFINVIDASPEGLSLVSTMIGLAHSLNLKVVAEGVELEAQARLLRLLRCDEMQGWLFSKAVTSDVFEEKFLRLASDTRP